MKKLALSFTFVVFLASANAMAKGNLLEIHFVKPSLKHHYFIEDYKKKKDIFVLSLIDEKGLKKNKLISAFQSQLIISHANRLLWDNKYRSPLKKCTEYMTLKVLGDQTHVCQENPSVTGRSFGLLNQLYALVHSQ